MPTTVRLSTALPCLLLLATACDNSVRTEELDFDEAIERVEVETGSGDIFVVGDPEREQLEVEAVIRGTKTRLRWAVDDAVLTLDHDCPAFPTGCSVDWYVWIPASGAEAVDLELDTASGDVSVDATFGNVRIETGSGNIEVRDAIADAVSLETGSGDVSLLRCEADDVEGEAGSGNIEVDLDLAPRRVALDTGSGDVVVAVPEDGYRLDLETGSGDVEVHGLTQDPDADRLIAVTTGSGNVTIHGR